MTYETKRCPFCAEGINRDAIKCKHCGEMLYANTQATHTAQNHTVVMRYRRWSPGVAALLSFFIPGVGQMYKGDVGTGIAWLIVTYIGYFLLIIPGLILHLICIITAASGDPYK
ncbi:TM2 domain-containing protein [Leeuwenhoekiella polynyae]|uniref:TM2 domain-containing protein n=1 Tax=Leeuwenhoekiella polynyae TaxID=1550906 RepID=A0A4Q0P4E3_9FLAO|nr:TM2 domain-containing protein [Leeuwenhoekiella polynyae]RXG21261.1 hypothetical protein DSM02_2114 [Leeuwenhoekiella polynyae]